MILKMMEPAEFLQELDMVQVQLKVSLVLLRFSLSKLLKAIPMLIEQIAHGAELVLYY